MRGYIASILIVGLALGGMGFGTFAWFTDQEIVKDNVITTGNVALTAWASKSHGFGSCEDQRAPLEVTNLVPSKNNWATMGYIHLKNDGTVPLKWRGYFESTDAGGDFKLDDNLEFRFRMKKGGGGDNGKGGGNSGGGNWEGFSDPYPWSMISSADDTPLNSDNFGGLLNCADGPGNQFGKTSLVLKVEVKLNEDAGNDYANKWVNFKAVFDATQTGNNGWTEDGSM